MRRFTLAAAMLGAFIGAATIPAMAAENTAPKPHQTEPGVTMVRGEITKIDGKTITVGETSFKVDEKTEIVSRGNVAYKEPLKVGQKVSARVKDGVAVRIEVHIPKATTN